MIVDLSRNDLWNLSKEGTIRVEGLKSLLKGHELWHLETKVSSVPKKEIVASDILKEIGPGGSITGAPKLEVIKVIQELEGCQRGFYTGAAGLIGGNCFHSMMPIRIVYGDGINSFFHVGGGIVIDSDFEEEKSEREVKSNQVRQIFYG